MDFRLGPEEEAFRLEVARFLDRELDPSVRQEQEERGLPGPLYYRFLRRCGERGLLSLTWAPRFGGPGKPPIYRFLFVEELARRGVEYRNVAESIVAPTLMLYGSPEQQREHLPQIARGEAVFCLLYSEPHAGSDLASLELRAEAQGDGYLLQGQKLFSSEADLADHAWLAARTDPHAPKHRGISVFLMEMKAPGVTVRPLFSMGGDRRFNEVFLDGVRLEKGWRVGEENRGWEYVAASLDFERATAVAAMLIGSATCMLADLLGHVRQQGCLSAPLRHRLAARAAELEVLRGLSYRGLSLMSGGKAPTYEASAIKLFGSELTQRLAQAALDILGLYGQLMPQSPRAPLGGSFARLGLRVVSDSIRGGTSEVQRNVIALRGLGLPAR